MGSGVSVWPSGQGERMAYPRRRPFPESWCQDADGSCDRSGLVVGCSVAKENPISGTAISMQNAAVPKRIVMSAQTTGFSKESESALRVATVYQDSLTRYWASELWDRVGQLVDHGGIYHQAWNIGGLADSRGFVDAVQAAAVADVLVVSVREAGELPIDLYVWIDAWMSRRAGRVGALVALIGVCPQPDLQPGRGYAYLEAVARRVGLDFLPRERQLPEQSPALSSPGGIALVATLTMPGSRDCSAARRAAA
jgi:hypothetical protein